MIVWQAVDPDQRSGRARDASAAPGARGHRCRDAHGDEHSDPDTAEVGQRRLSALRGRFISRARSLQQNSGRREYRRPRCRDSGAGATLTMRQPRLPGADVR